VVAHLSQLGGPAIPAPGTLDHLGGAEAPALDLSVLLPLPGTTVAGVLAFHLESRREHVLEVFSRGVVIARLEGSLADTIALDTTTLTEGAKYEWVLYGLDAAGSSRELRGGTFVIASRAAAELHDSILSKSPQLHVSVCKVLGMHDEVMRTLWGGLWHSDTPLEDRSWAYERLLHAFEYSLERHPQLAQVDAYRTAAGSLLSSLREGEHP
jgi:hypothetical protein